MAKIKLTTLTDKMSDDEVLAKLKNISRVKVKDKEKVKDQTLQEGKSNKTTGLNETVIEKRIATAIIRRRVQPPQAKDIEKTEVPVETTKLPDKELELLKPFKEKKEEPEIVEKPVVMTEELTKADDDVSVKKKTSTIPEVVMVEVEKEGTPEEIQEEKLKGDIELIEEEKKKEITKVLEEAYKHELEKDVTLGDKEKEEEERKKKKTERLLKKLEEQELEEQKLKKKSPLKRKVIIKEEDLYAFRKQKAKTSNFRKDRHDRKVEKKVEEEKRLESRPARKTIKIGGIIQVDMLAKKLGVKAQEVISRLLALGVMATINQTIDFDTAYLIATELGFETERSLSIEDEFTAMEEDEKENLENLKPRSPVVTIMGHVDHGKTLLLDTIRHTKVAEGEAGGITQHIGAYVADVNGKEIAFVDTPGHEAFTAMRARGARVTDIVILVVAADDGVMPQTIEAMNHAKAANVPIIVAINKIDKENANPDKVIKDLAEFGLLPEEWGGTTLFAKISAKKNIGIQELLELIVLQAEMLELKANPDKAARGIIIESELDKGQGPVGTVIIQEGTLKIQDPFVAGSMFGRVRAMFDDKGRRIQKAPPSTPVLVVGFHDVPHAGDRFIVTTEEGYARELSKFRQEKLKEQGALKNSRTTLEELYSKMDESEKTTLNLIVKGDVRGTIDAIIETINKMSNKFVDIQVIHSGVGAITETDINLAMASGAIVIGFNTKPVGKAQSLAEHEKIEIRTYSIIYDMIDDLKKAMEGMLAPKIVETIIGKAEVRKVFTVSKLGTIAGCYMIEGKATRNSFVKVMRKNNILFTGKLASLKRFKDDVKEVLTGYECGISVENFNDIQESDSLVFFIEEKEKQTLDG